MDHILAMGEGLNRTMEAFDAWVLEKGLADNASS
jgi:hypothetical protein